MEATCLVRGCGRPVRQRGLCGACASSARKRVKRGETTWEELVELGLALESARLPTGHFDAALRKARDAAKRTTPEVPPRESPKPAVRAAEGPAEAARPKPQSMDEKPGKGPRLVQRGR